MLINKGDTIGIISPSAPITEDLKAQFSKGLQVFENMGFKVKLSKNVYANTLGYSATVDEKVHSGVTKQCLERATEQIINNIKNACI